MVPSIRARRLCPANGTHSRLEQVKGERERADRAWRARAIIKHFLEEGVFRWASEDEKGFEIHFPGSPLCKGGMQRRERITATGETNCARGGKIPYYQVGQ